MHAFHIRYHNTQGTLMRILNAASRRALDIPYVHAKASGPEHKATLLLEVNVKQIGTPSWTSPTSALARPRKAGMTWTPSRGRFHIPILREACGMHRPAPHGPSRSCDCGFPKPVFPNPSQFVSCFALQFQPRSS
jgi:hypothetical protein